MKENIKKNKIMYTDTKLNVPYYSQYLSVDNKENSLKSCGITCIYMMLCYYKIDVPSLNQMVLDGIKNGGYSQSGWIHDYFVQLINKLGLFSERKESMRDVDVEILKKDILNGNPIVISTERRLFDKRTFHMVILTGIREDENGNLEGFFYHDPASLQPETAEHCYVPVKTFFLSWRRMAIFVREKH